MWRLRSPELSGFTAPAWSGSPGSLILPEERLAERTRIAQELHDTLLQGFLSSSMQVHVAADRLPEDSPSKPILERPATHLASD